MGFFSWFTSDTEKSIANNYSTRETFPVYMITEDGQVFYEEDYGGYGEFGGKDIYVLAAEMNGHKGENDEETRMLFFDKIWLRGVKKGDKRYYHNKDFSVYTEPIESEGGICANDLVSQHGWESFGDGGEFEYWAEQGLKMPKLVENLPLVSPIHAKDRWKEIWDSLPYPKSCPDQGFFYDDEDDDEETCINCGERLTTGNCPSCD
jgi:hypothetical protein